jgi:hypothetical protein
MLVCNAFGLGDCRHVFCACLYAMALDVCGLAVFAPEVISNRMGRFPAFDGWIDLAATKAADEVNSASFVNFLVLKKHFLAKLGLLG